MSWQTYVDDHLVATGHVQQGALLGLDGSVWATTPGFDVTEGAALANKFTNPDLFAAEGGTLAGVKYFSIKFNDENAEEGKVSWYGKKGAGGVCVAKSTQCLIVGVYGEGINPANANTVVEGVRDYLMSTGY
eukprot:NODE_10482_length_590_cov_122.503212_g7712_i1.p1 GENE.NODE_10482_length_590_cov_122.503212_g7712_i1~~NODE_10482_length_590_cov_122.503212_g7712_i1.p1  ORF type:complete len:132 (+),score=31.41 NODE_10482_length_590_cov_122.503212_g7712_i1:63-458(+)